MLLFKTTMTYNIVNNITYKMNISFPNNINIIYANVGYIINKTYY